MHLLLKWNTDYETDTVERHRIEAQSQGSTWWSCDSTSPKKRAASSRVGRLEEQLQRGTPTFAFTYRLGDPATVASVWRANIEEVTVSPTAAGSTFMPSGLHAFMFLRLSSFTSVKPGWVLANLRLFDSQKPLDQGALGNQQTPLYVELRGPGPFSE